jgi:hypothetical protein
MAVIDLVQNEDMAARAAVEEALRIGRQLRNADMVGWSLIGLSIAAWIGHDGQETVSRAESALALARIMDDGWLAAWALHLISYGKLAQGALDGVYRKPGCATARRRWPPPSGRD